MLVLDCYTLSVIDNNRVYLIKLRSISLAILSPVHSHFSAN